LTYKVHYVKYMYTTAHSGPSSDRQDAAVVARIADFRRERELWVCSNSHIADTAAICCRGERECRKRSYLRRRKFGDAATFTEPDIQISQIRGNPIRSFAATISSVLHADLLNFAVAALTATSDPEQPLARLNLLFLDSRG